MKMERCDGLKGYTLTSAGMGMADWSLGQRDAEDDGFIALACAAVETEGSFSEI